MPSITILRGHVYFQLSELHWKVAEFKSLQKDPTWENCLLIHGNISRENLDIRCQEMGGVVVVGRIKVISWSVHELLKATGGWRAPVRKINIFLPLLLISLLHWRDWKAAAVRNKKKKKKKAYNRHIPLFQTAFFKLDQPWAENEL